MYEYNVVCKADFCAAMLAHLTNVWFHTDLADHKGAILAVTTDDYDTLRKVMDYVTEKGLDHGYATSVDIARANAVGIRKAKAVA